MDETDTATDLSIRVVLAELPAMVAVLVREALLAGGITSVEEVGDRAQLSELVARRGAEVVIVPTETSGVARQYHELLQRNPDLRILTIAAVAHSTDVYQLRLLGSNVGRQGVVAAVRAVMRDETDARRDS